MWLNLPRWPFWCDEFSARAGKRAGRRSRRGPRSGTRRLLLAVLPFFVHVLDRRLVDQQVGLAVAGYLDTALVVPLDHAANFFPVAEHDYHRCLGLHLLLVVEVLGVGLLCGSSFPAAPVAVAALRTLGSLPMLSCRGKRMIVVVAVQRRTDQLAVGKALCFHRALGWE